MQRDNRTDCQEIRLADCRDEYYNSRSRKRSSSRHAGDDRFPVLMPDNTKYKLTAHVMSSAIGRLRTARFPANFLNQFDGTHLQTHIFTQLIL